MNVGQNTTLRNGYVPEKLIQLLIVADRKLKMTGDNTGLLVVTGSIAGQFQDLSGEILEYSGEINRGSGTNTLSIVSLPEQTMNTSDWERKTRLGRTPSSDLLARNRGSLKTETYDCAFLEPLALPPDLPPPVIL